MENIIKNNNGTEAANEMTKDLDMMSIKDILLLMHKDNNSVMSAIENAISKIENVAEKAYATLLHGGRIIYIGAGTSGRLGVLDASECPPTFGVPNDMFVGLIAGGDRALRDAIEGAEDDRNAAVLDLKSISISKNDMLIGIAASGRTPYVIGGLEYAKDLGACTAAIVNNQDTAIGRVADETIELLTGPEVISGSTRLKAGTSQKIVLNMISTSIMIRSGKVYGNLMVDVNPTNEKLRMRAESIVMKVTNVNNEKAKAVLKEAEWNPKLAIVMIMTNNDKKISKKMLDDANGFLRKALENSGVKL